MKKNIQNLVFILIICALLISPLIFWLSRDGAWTEDSILEDRKLVVFPQVSLQEFKTGLKRIYQGCTPKPARSFSISSSAVLSSARSTRLRLNKC